MADADSRTDAVRDLGTRIKLATQLAESGGSVESAQIAEWDRSLAALRSSPVATGFETKRSAVERLFWKLKFLVAQPPAQREAAARVAHAAPRDRAHVDRQTIGKEHGDSCESALGIHSSVPVEVALSAAGNAGDGAWLRFEPAAAGYYRFSTDSSGTDPQIAIFPDCSGKRTAEVESDDDVGLDASATLSLPASKPVFVHLTNLWRAGMTYVEVTDGSGIVNGQVTDAVTAQPIAGARVTAYYNSSSYSNSVFADLSGNYSLPLFAGSYYLRADDDTHVSILYPNVQCSYPSIFYNISNCNLAQGQLVAVDSGANLQGFDFALPPGRAIEGIIRDTANQPVPGSVAQIYDGAGHRLDGVNADAYGRFSFTPLPPGNYKVSADAGGFGQQMFNHVDCSGPLRDQCDLSKANLIAVGSGNVANVNFNLQRLASLQGNVFAGADQPIQSYSVFVVDGYGNSVAQEYYVYGNPYKVGPLALGTYYVYVVAGGYFSQIFNGVDCGANCLSSIGAATPVTLSQIGQTAQADFHLDALPLVHGHVQDAISALPLANVQVMVSVNPPGTYYSVASAMTDASGNYSIANVPSGVYYLWVQSQDHIDQVYSGIPCEQLGYNSTPCDVSGATLLTVTPGQALAEFDFQLQRASSISGTAIINAGPDSDLPAHIGIGVYDVSGTLIATTSTDASGHYSVGDLAPGSYFAYANPNFGDTYQPQLWQLIDCPNGCAPTTGTSIPLAAHADVAGIDFFLVDRNTIVGRIVDMEDAPIAGVLVDLFDSTTGAYSGTAISDAQGYYAVSPAYGSAFFVATDSARAYVDQVHSGISCPNGSAYAGLCPLAKGTAVGLSFFNTEPIVVNFTLKVSDYVFVDGFE